MRAIQITATLCMAAGIACGAFGAHALRDIVGEGGVLSVDPRSGSATDNIGNWATDLR